MLARPLFFHPRRASICAQQAGLPPAAPARCCGHGSGNASQDIVAGSHPLRSFLFSKIRRLWQISPVATLFAGLVVGYCAWILLWIAPQHLFLAWRISRLPSMDAAAVATVTPGDDVLVTGRLADNPTAEYHFVCYALERWKVKTSPDSAGKPYGRWEDAEGYFPDLHLMVDGQRVLIQGNPDVTLLGDVHLETYEAGSGRRLAIDAIHMPDGTLRYHGLRNDDHVTALGRKATSGAITPSYLFVGDRETFLERQWKIAKNLFLAAFFLMLISPPLVYLLTALFMGKWKLIFRR